MNYFYDYHYLKYAKPGTKNELISIGIISESNNEYYAISKDFNVEEAWNRYEVETDGEGVKIKIYKIRENVLLPIWNHYFPLGKLSKTNKKFILDDFKLIIGLYGKTYENIKQDIIELILNLDGSDLFRVLYDDQELINDLVDYEYVVFNGYGDENFDDVFCGLNKLKIKDIKQTITEKINQLSGEIGFYVFDCDFNEYVYDFNECITDINSVNFVLNKVNFTGMSFKNKLETLNKNIHHTRTPYPIKHEDQINLENAKKNKNLLKFINKIPTIK